MYAMTVDQIDSRNGTDLVDDAMTALDSLLGDRIVFRPERTAGDEFQLGTDSAEAILDAALHLTRAGRWSIGVGIGDVDVPLPTSTRAATGSAFYRARTAVDRAKRLPEHFALEIEPGRRLTTADLEPLVVQTLRLRSRRSPEGWELADLLADGRSRSEAAAALGISTQAVAKRFGAADLRDEGAVDAALVRLLAEADLPALETP